MSDTMPSFKHDTEAEIGELFFSRETLKLSFKKDIGDFIRYEETPAVPVAPYKVFVALVTQSGTPTEDSLNNGTLTLGRTYRINEVSPGMDFTNVGAPNNDLGTAFIATATTPNSWGSGATYTLAYDAGAPTVKVLENTLGNLWFSYSTVGNYHLFSDALFTEERTFVTTGDLEDCCSMDLLGRIVSNLAGNELCELLTFDSTGTLVDDQLGFTPLEIRVYN